MRGREFSAHPGQALINYTEFAVYQSSGNNPRDSASAAALPFSSAVMVFATGQYQSLASVPARSYLFLLLSGLATGASWVCYYRALKLGDASRVAPLDKLSVVLVAIFALLFLGERLSAKNWAGIAMIAGGAVLVASRARA